MNGQPSLPPALILGGDSAIALAVIRELGSHGVPVIVADNAPHALARHSRHVHRFILTPRGEDQPLARWLPSLIEESGAKLLFAIGEQALLELAELSEIIHGCQILTPRREQLANVLDKSRTLAIARELGFSVPESWHPVAGEDFQVRAAAVHYPVVLKWSDPPALWPKLEAAGLPFLKAEYAANPAELIECLSRYDSLGQWPMVQSWCKGYGLGQMLLMEDGQAVLRFQHRRLREYPATGGVSTLCTALPADSHRAQMQLSERLLAALDWRGSAMVEYRYDPATGRYWLMEVNGRFWGSLSLASQCGVPFAWEAYRRAVLPDTPGHAPRPGWPLRRARFVLPDTKRLLTLWANPALPTQSGGPRASRWRETLHWLADFLHPRTGYYIWSWRDPAPFFMDMITAVLRRRHRHKDA